MNILIEETVPLTIRALKAGINKEIIRFALVVDGVSAKNADIIIRWAVQHIIKGS